jgi:hypothetical protein
LIYTFLIGKNVSVIGITIIILVNPNTLKKKRSLLRCHVVQNFTDDTIPKIMYFNGVILTYNINLHKISCHFTLRCLRGGTRAEV